MFSAPQDNAAPTPRIDVMVNSTRRAGLADAFRQRATVRVSEVLGPFAPHIRDVLLSVHDVNGDKGGPDDKVCQVMVRAATGGNHVLAVARAASHWEALNTALRRAKRQLDRRTKPVRSTIRPAVLLSRTA